MSVALFWRVFLHNSRYPLILSAGLLSEFVTPVLSRAWLIISAQFRFFVVVFTGFLSLKQWCNPTHSPGAAVGITNPLKKGWTGSTFESVLIRFQCGFECVLVRFARNFVTSSNPIWDHLCGSLLLFDFLESRFPARIIKKLFQCAAKPAGSETIDDRIDPIGYEYAGVY